MTDHSSRRGQTAAAQARQFGFPANPIREHAEIDPRSPDENPVKFVSDERFKPGAGRHARAHNKKLLDFVLVSVRHPGESDGASADNPASH